jgi:cytochrome c oxidase subunit 2
MSGAAPGGTSSILAPASVEAALLQEVSWVLIVGGALIFAATMLLLAGAVRPGARRSVPAAWWIVGGGVAFPAVVLAAQLLYSTARTAGLERTLANPALTVSLQGRMWWWDVRYPGPDPGRAVRLANELRLPVGRPTQIALTSDEVIHSFWVPELGGKRDLVPGRVNHIVVTPLRAGVYRGSCAEYCGTQHARMALHVVVMPAGEFDRWLAQQRAPAPAPMGETTRGREAFRDQGCAACHADSGDGDGGPLGPDLTHVASRPTLGAGALPNGPGAIRRWLVDIQQLKPGARMPSYAHLDPATLDALAAYLEQPR